LKTILLILLLEKEANEKYFSMRFPIDPLIAENQVLKNCINKKSSPKEIKKFTGRYYI
jgi:hypothetical protein